MQTLKGTVKGKWSGIALSGAVVIVNGVTVIADTTGSFSINVMQPQANIQVMHVNYATLTETITMNGDMTIGVDLTPTARALH